MQLEINNLCKRYPNGTQPLLDVSLSIPQGMFGLLGPNGAGKSTLMRTLATLQEADSGSAWLDGIFALAIIIFYFGELMWRERDAQLAQVVDSLPLQRWVLFCSKLSALMLVLVVVLTILAAGLTVQIAQGYYHFEFSLYFRELFLNRLTQLWILCVLAIFVQTVARSAFPTSSATSCSRVKMKSRRGREFSS